MLSGVKPSKDKPLTDTQQSSVCSHLTFGKKTNKPSSKNVKLWKFSLCLRIQTETFDLKLKWVQHFEHWSTAVCFHVPSCSRVGLYECFTSLRNAYSTLKIKVCIRSTSYCYLRSRLKDGDLFVHHVFGHRENIDSALSRLTAEFIMQKCLRWSHETVWRTARDALWRFLHQPRVWQFWLRERLSSWCHTEWGRQSGP